jgi:hypothetical protein
VEGVEGAIGALEVWLTLPGKPPKKVYSKLERGDPRVKPHNVDEVVWRIEKEIGE